MKEEVWERHAHPLSVWTRVITGLPVTLGAVWTIEPLGRGALVPIGLAVLWLWLNPRIFPVPSRRDSWASRVTLGERLWLDRRNRPIPEHHARVAIWLCLLTGLGFLAALAGAWRHEWLWLAPGAVASWTGKMWFCDRMVWLYEDLRREDPTLFAGEARESR